MIRYALACENGHHFESWFQSAAAFDTLQASGHIGCETCGSTQITKTIMAPAVPKKNAKDVAEKIEAIRKEVETNADYVGSAFYTEARAMHDGETPERAIYGQANAEQAKSLIADGIPVMPLPFIPKKQVN